MAHGRNWRDSIQDELKRVFTPATHALTVIDTHHRLVHDGMLFLGNFVLASLANSNSVYMHMVTGTLPVHMKGGQLNISDAPITTEIYEEPTISANGTEFTNVINLNRLSANTPQSTIYTGPTVIDDGTQLLISSLKDVGTGINNVSILPDSRVELVFKPNTSYLWKITNTSGGAISLSAQFYFYEATYED